VIADLIGIHAGDYLVTEAGFGADMGAERFFNIKCRTSGLRPDAAVIVATVRAPQGRTPASTRSWPAGRCPRTCSARTRTTWPRAAANLRKQIENIRLHGVSPVVAINAFPTDHASEHQVIRDIAADMGAAGRRCARTSPTAAGAPSSWPRR